MKQQLPEAAERNTVRKILRSDETSLSDEREIQPHPKLRRWKADIDRMLATNAEAPARERLMVIRLFEELRALGYEGSYDAVRRYAKAWAANTRAGRRARTFPCRLRQAKPASSTGATRSWCWTAPSKPGLKQLSARQVL